MERLLDMFVVSKMTGLEKPVPVEFEEFAVEGDPQLGLNASSQLPDYLEEWSVPQSTTGKVREGRNQLFTRRARACSLFFTCYVSFLVTCIVYFECVYSGLCAVRKSSSARAHTVT